MNMLPTYSHNHSPSQQAAAGSQTRSLNCSDRKGKPRLDFKEGDRQEAQPLGGAKPLHHKQQARAPHTKICVESQGL